MVWFVYIGWEFKGLTNSIERKNNISNFLVHNDSLTNVSIPGLGLLRKFQQYRRLPQEPPAAPTHHLEEELDRLTGKIVRIDQPQLRPKADH